jgi:hypothetical protein
VPETAGTKLSAETLLETPILGGEDPVALLIGDFLGR